MTQQKWEIEFDEKFINKKTTLLGKEYDTWKFTRDNEVEDIKSIKSFITQTLESEITNYQRDFEQQHIASALEVARKEWERELVERIEKKYPNYVEDYHDEVEEIISLITSSEMR